MEDGNTALILASQEGHLECVKSLAEIEGINMTLKNFTGANAIVISIQKGHYKVTFFLLFIHLKFNNI